MTTAIAATVVPLLVTGGTAVAMAGTGAAAPFTRSVEAEDGPLGNGAHTVACGFCSGGTRVAGLGGRDHGVTTLYVRIPEEGDYTVTVHYVSGATRALSVNDKRLTRLNSGGWDRVATRSVKVHLKERFGRPAVLDLGYDTHTRGADVDKVVVTR
jgi:hypothetical protein